MSEKEKQIKELESQIMLLKIDINLFWYSELIYREHREQIEKLEKELKELKKEG